MKKITPPQLDHSRKTGLSFGLTSAIITTLGLMVGLNAGTGSRLAVIGGILTIAVADAFSDALGIHMSEEAENVHTPDEIWASTLSTWVTKFVIALTFMVAMLMLPLENAIMVNIIWGLSLLGVFSYYIGKKQHGKPWDAVKEHLIIAMVVIVITHNFGHWISATFG